MIVNPVLAGAAGGFVVTIEKTYPYAQ